MLITELPLWTTCPFAHRVRKPLEVRRGIVGGLDITVISDGIHFAHVPTDKFDRVTCDAMIQSLGWVPRKKARH